MTRDTTTVNPWLIAVTVTIATFMELLDTSIANVSLPHIAGGLATSYDESTWVLTSYLVANAVVLPLSAWLSRALRAQALLHDVRRAVQRQLAAVRPRAEPRHADLLPRAAGHRRRRPRAGGTGDPRRHVPRREARGGVRALQHGHRHRAGDRPDPRRLDHRQLLVAVGLLHQRADRPACRCCSRAGWCPIRRRSRRKSRSCANPGKLRIDYVGIALVAIGFSCLESRARSRTARGLARKPASSRRCSRSR